MSLRTRLTLLVAVAVGLAVVSFAVVATLTTRNELRGGVDQALEQRAGALGGPRRGGDGPPRPGNGSDPLGAVDTTTRIFDERGVVANGAAVTDEAPLTERDIEVAARTGPAYFRDGEINGDHLRIYTSPAGRGQAVQFSRSVSGLDDTIRRLTYIYVLLGLLGVAAAGLIGWAVARRSLRPVDDLTKAVERVAKDRDLTSEIEVERRDEVGRLAMSFNDMLRALRRSRQQQQQLVTDASHELRTPLTSLRTNVEVLHRLDELDPVEQGELLADLRAEMEDLTGLVGELVDLATEDDQSPESTVEVRFDELVGRMAGRTERRTGLAVTCDLQPSTVIGRPTRLERAVGNLLENAGKWSPAGGVIDVRVAGGTVTVSDQGPGIAEVDLPRVFDRFYRADAARSMPGSGLGLAIVRQVVEEHGGTVHAGRAPGGGAAIGFTLPVT